ncbi:MAG: tripartite tricarboxylate transporter permease [Spirochaetia bacterium]|nr:tripartite tricarboxylate transporter permease [Spirochaetia bacterium]
MIDIVLSVVNPLTILVMSAGVSYGIIFGAIPGLSSSVAVALIIPLTYSMDSLLALSLLVSVYVGGVSGGLISAILLRIPGTPSSIVTTFDGYPLAQKGQAGNAIGLAIFSSVIGGLIGAIFLLTLSPLLARVTIMFSPFDYFGITVFSLSLVCMLLGANALKGLITTLIGLTLSFVGTSPIDARPRFTFGNHNLDNGFNIIVLIIGVFAISEMLNSVSQGKKQNEKTLFTKKQGFMPSLAKIRFHAVNMFRSGLIGTALGILPGLSGPEAALISYTRAKKRSKNPELFGDGSEEGLVASESSNNAVAGGALIPMLALGVPGNAVAAVIMGGFIIHGVQVGPMLFTNSPNLVRGIMLAFLIANILMLIIESLAIKGFVKILSVPKQYLYPIIIMFCVIGVNSVNNRFFDALIMLFFGVVGFILEKNRYPLGPLVLGFILGSIIELNYRRAIMYYGSFTNIISSSFTMGTVFLFFAIVMVFINFILPLFASMRKKPKKKTEQ